MKRIISVVLCAALVVPFLFVSASASETGGFQCIDLLDAPFFFVNNVRRPSTETSTSATSFTFMWTQTFPSTTARIVIGFASDVRPSSVKINGVSCSSMSNVLVNSLYWGYYLDDPAVSSTITVTVTFSQATTCSIAYCNALVGDYIVFSNINNLYSGSYQFGQVSLPYTLSEYSSDSSAQWHFHAKINLQQNYYSKVALLVKNGTYQSLAAASASMITTSSDSIIQAYLPVEILDADTSDFVKDTLSDARYTWVVVDTSEFSYALASHSIEFDLSLRGWYSDTSKNISFVTAVGIYDVAAVDFDALALDILLTTIESGFTMLSSRLSSWFNSTWTKMVDGFKSVTDRLDTLINPDSDTSASASLVSQGQQMEEYDQVHQEALVQGLPTLQASGDISNFATPLAFVGGYLTSVFNALGDYQIVFTLPLVLGFILFLCSRVRGFDKPRKHNKTTDNATKPPGVSE